MRPSGTEPLFLVNAELKTKMQGEQLASRYKKLANQIIHKATLL